MHSQHAPKSDSGESGIHELRLAGPAGKSGRSVVSRVSIALSMLAVASLLLYLALLSAHLRGRVDSLERTIDSLESKAKHLSSREFCIDSDIGEASNGNIKGSGGGTSLATSQAVEAVKNLGLSMPLRGVGLPEGTNLYPGAKRGYRGGVHEGIDMYCSYGEPVYASADGYIAWIDDSYEELSPDSRNRLLKESRQVGITPGDILWLLKGRKVVISHGVFEGYRISTVYAHLHEVFPGLALGSLVKKGQHIGSVGNSGTSDGARGSKNGAHLHYEVRIDDRSGNHYLGEGLQPQESKKIFTDVIDSG